MTHSFGWCSLVLPEFSNPFMAPLVAASVVDDLNCDGVPDNDEGVLWGSVLTSIPGDLQPIEAAHNLPPGMRRWGQGFKDWFSENYRRLMGIHNQVPSFPSKKYYCDLDPAVKDKFGQPALRITHDWSEHDVACAELLRESQARHRRGNGRHPVLVRTQRRRLTTCPRTRWAPTGWARIPADSVVDIYGESHECKGLLRRRRRPVPHAVRLQPDPDPAGPGVPQRRPHPRQGLTGRTGYSLNHPKEDPACLKPQAATR